MKISLLIEYVSGRIWFGFLRIADYQQQCGGGIRKEKLSSHLRRKW